MSNLNNLNNNIDNSNNGLLTKVWGPHMWVALHSIAHGFPIKPSPDHKQNYLNFYTSLQYVLPCKFCRDSYAKFIKEDDTLLNLNVFDTRDSLTLWIYKIHEKVNKKLGIEYCVTYDDVCEKYESYRAKCTPDLPGCVMPLHLKAESFNNANKKDCPIIEIAFAECFEKYAITRGFTQFKENLEKYSKLRKDKQNDGCKANKEWDERNEKCDEIIKEMRIDSIDSTEKNGIYRGLPTMKELELISMLCSNLCKKDLLKSIKSLGYDTKCIYKLKN